MYLYRKPLAISKTVSHPRADRWQLMRISLSYKHEAGKDYIATVTAINKKVISYVIKRILKYHSSQSYVWFGFIVYIALQNWVSHKLDFAARLLIKDWLSPTVSCQTSLYHKRDQLWSNLYKDVTFPVNPKSDHTVSRQSIIKPSDLQDYRLTRQ